MILLPPVSTLTDTLFAFTTLFRSRHRRDFGEREIGLARRLARVAARRLDQPGGHALLVFEQRLEQMFRRNLLMVHADRDGLRRLQEALGAIGEFLEVHAVPFIVHRSDSVALMQHKPIRPISSCRIYSGIQPSTSVTA